MPSLAAGGELRAACRWELDATQCPAPVSVSPVHDALRRAVYVCALDGAVVAVQVAEEAAGSAVGSYASVAWRARMPAPLFSAPAVCPGSGTLVVAAVDGSMAGLSTSGERLWSHHLGAPCYAPLCCQAAPSDGAGAAMVIAMAHDGVLWALRCAVAAWPSLHRNACTDFPLLAHAVLS